MTKTLSRRSSIDRPWERRKDVVRIFGPVKTACIILVFCATAFIAGSAQTFTTVGSFDGTDGYGSFGPLIQGLDGNFYGTTSEQTGKPQGGGGTVFQITPGGQLTTIYSFCSKTNSSGLCLDGAFPAAALLQASNGKFYGTTVAGGANVNKTFCTAGKMGCGTVFEIAPDGTLTTLHSFCSQPNCDDGIYPEAALVAASNGDLYGTAERGGLAGCVYGCGTLFKITPAGEFRVVYRFCSLANCADGSFPTMLLGAANGKLYGVTAVGGAQNAGTVFSLTLAGNLTTVYSFCSLANCTDGSGPNSLMQAANGNFYGTTSTGGADTTDSGGTIFRLSPAGKLTTLHSFCSKLGCDGFKAGNSPQGPLVQASNGNFYGLTYGGGNRYQPLCRGTGYGCGTIFEISPTGVLTTLYRFASQLDADDGANPEGGVLQVDGTLYGVTSLGGNGSGHGGTVFSLVP